MSENGQKYLEIFKETLNVTEDEVKGLRYQAVESWDSVGHMALIAAIEDAFDLMLDAEDIISFESYEKGMEILEKNYDIVF